jgi:hypothetical protein
MPGVRGQAGFPLYVREAGYRRRPAAIAQALEVFRKSDYRFKELLVALVKSKEFSVSGRTVNVASNHKTSASVAKNLP